MYLALVLILLSGDSQPNPDPIRHPCSDCGKPVKANQRGIYCDGCELWVHSKCIAVDVNKYNDLAHSTDPWLCPRCVLDNNNNTACDDTAIPSYIPAPTDSHPSASPIGPISFHNEYNCFQTKGLHFIHLNTRSLPPKVDELRLIASSSKAAIIGITETWLDDSVSDTEINIPGYLLYRQDRKRSGGGVCIYVRSDIHYSPRTDLGESMESIWVEL